MARAESSTTTRLLTLAATFVIVAGLYLAAEFLVPLALAILFSFLLAPLAHRLESWGLGRVISVLTVAIVTFAILIGIGWIVAGQLVDLAGKLPEYRGNITEKLQTLRGSGRTLGKARETIQQIEKELTDGRDTKAEQKAPENRPVERLGSTQPPREQRPESARPEAEPVAVKVVEEPLNAFNVIGNTLGAIAGPLANAALVALFVIFILIYREDMRDRCIRLIGEGQIQVATEAIDEAATRISRYLLMQFIVNATYGLPVAIGLYFIGVPNAFLWGLLAALMRYLPYIGPWIAASMPILVAFAVGEWWQLGATVGLFVVLEIISNNIMEPLLYGSSAGISPVALLGAAAFWTWLWGAIGLFLSTPLTVLLVVLGKYVPQLDFLYILLGDKPVLEPQARFYQRLLAMDQEEASDLMEEYLEQMPLVQFYDKILMPALELSEKDRHQGRLDAEKQKFIRQTVTELIDQLGERKKNEEKCEIQEAAHEGAAEVADKLEQRTKEAPILCIPASDDADHVAARMLSQILEENGLHAPTTEEHASPAEVVEEVARRKTKVVCISALPPSAISHVRRLCRELHSRFPDLTIIVGLWNSNIDGEKLKRRVNAARSDKAVGTLADAADQVIKSVEPLITSPRAKFA